MTTSNKPVRLLQIDAFTDKPFSGNPAAVCLLDGPRDERWMQAVSAEMNLSETAFVVARGGDFDLRWFTPACEVELCGHATLASAHALWETGVLLSGQSARFHTASGLLTVVRRGEAMEMDFPAKPAVHADAPDGLLEALDVGAVFIGNNGMDNFVEIREAETLRGLHPDFALLKKIRTRGIIVTAASDDPRYDFLSRFFAPGAGVDEDPVTGSAHCCLGPYWQGKLGKADLRAYQASRRGGELGVSVRGDRVLLTGRAVTVLRGELA
jgi:PhzF family phenazine biosynthesis protein